MAHVFIQGTVRNLRMEGNKSFGGEGRFLESGEASVIDGFSFTGNVHIDEKYLKELAAMKSAGQSQQSAIKLVMDGMGAVADASTIISALAAFWNSI